MPGPGLVGGPPPKAASFRGWVFRGGGGWDICTWKKNSSYNILLKSVKWYFVTRIVLTYYEKNFVQTEGREFAKFLRSVEQFIQTVKGQNNFW